MFFKQKEIKETAECRFCKRVENRDGIYVCRRKGQVPASGSCPAYRFDPFAKREPRRRNIDTSVYDPLDFEI